MKRRRGHAAGAAGGFTLIEVLAALALSGVVFASLFGLLIANVRGINHAAHVSTAMGVAQDKVEQIRSGAAAIGGSGLVTGQGMDMMGDTLRTAGYGVPGAPLANWITWVNGFGQNPTIVHTGGLPDAISIAGATSQAVAQLTAHVDVGGTTLSVSDASGLNVG